MRITIDGAGRIVVPMALRERLGLVKGSELDIVEYAGSPHLSPVGGYARLVETDDGLVAEGDPAVMVTDEDVRALRDSGRRSPGRGRRVHSGPAQPAQKIQ